MRAVRVWDLPTRLLHWINVLTVLALAGVGLILMNLGALGIRPPAALYFKQLHVWAGYVLALSLGLRFVWAFCGSATARWSALLPYGSGYWGALEAELRTFLRGRPAQHAAHTPGGRMAITLLFALLAVMAVTGLVLAGTDIYYPPFGRYFAQWVAAPGIHPASVVPYEPSLVDLRAFKEVREFRRPFIVTHSWAFYGLSALVVAHVAAVVWLEVRGGGALVSAMISGRKLLPDSQSSVADTPASARAAGAGVSTSTRS